MIDSFEGWFAELSESSAATAMPQDAVCFSQYIKVFRPGSKVCLREQGHMTSEAEVIDVTLMDSGLMYQVRAAPRFPTGAAMKRWVSASYLEPSGESTEWEYGFWDTELQEYVTDAAVEHGQA